MESLSKHYRKHIGKFPALYDDTAVRQVGEVRLTSGSDTK